MNAINKKYVCSSLVGIQYIKQLREYIMDDIVRGRFIDCLNLYLDQLNQQFKF